MAVRRPLWTLVLVGAARETAGPMQEPSARGVASHRPSRSRRKTQSEAGDGCWPPHGGKVVGDGRAHAPGSHQPHRSQVTQCGAGKGKNCHEGLTTAAT